jgi:Glycosyl hydrolase family 71
LHLAKAFAPLPALTALCLTLMSQQTFAANSAIPADLPTDPCLPIEMPSRDAIFASPRKVFAHYFNPLPLSMDNKKADKDYYALQYLSPSGENNKWLPNGGYLRSRPLPVPIHASWHYVVENLKKEIELALSRGIGGFTYDILSLDDIKPRGPLADMLQAAAEVDPRFKIVLMPDMSALGPDAGKVLAAVRALYHDEGLLHSPDGRLVVSPFLSESVPASAWEAALLEARKDGYDISFVPSFLSLKSEYAEHYANISDGLGTFGTPLPGEGEKIAAATSLTHKAGKIYMAGISPQGYRPKEYVFWESEGSLAYRNSWMGAIAGNADWVQLTTWNDFGESTQVEPYTDLNGSPGTGYFNLTGYYTAWFLNHSEPTITHDVLYYFYRKEPTNAAAPRAGKRTLPVHFYIPGRNMIEILGFLTAPGTLKVSIGANHYAKDVGAGIQSFAVPLGAGTPRFSLLRGGSTPISFEGTPAIVDERGLPSGYADLTYWSGSASAAGICELSAAGSFR